MRRLAFGFAFLWLACAFGIRLYDMRKPQIYISALTGGQQGEHATLAWLQGTLMWRKQPQYGRLVVVDVRVDGKIERYASAGLPPDWLDCRLWLEEGPNTVQAVANCPNREAIRLTAAGQSLPGLGPDNKPPVLHDLGPLSSIEPDRIVNRIHRRDNAPAHPSLLLLGLLAMVPLLVLAWRDLKLMRRLRGDTMAVEGLRAAVQGETVRQFDGAFRGGESLRLGEGAVLVVGDGLSEARHRLGIDAALNVGLALSGVLLSAIVALGFGW